MKIARRNINSLRCPDDTTVMAESEEEPNSLSMRVKEESEKAGLKLSVQKMKVMASSHFVVQRKVEAVIRFVLLGSKITADGDCCHEIKRRLLLGRKAVTKLDTILKSRNITL